MNTQSLIMSASLLLAVACDGTASEAAGEDKDTSFAPAVFDIGAGADAAEGQVSSDPPHNPLVSIDDDLRFALPTLEQPLGELDPSDQGGGPGGIVLQDRVTCLGGRSPSRLMAGSRLPDELPVLRPAPVSVDARSPVVPATLDLQALPMDGLRDGPMGQGGPRSGRMVSGPGSVLSTPRDPGQPSFPAGDAPDADAAACGGVDADLSVCGPADEAPAFSCTEGRDYWANTPAEWAGLTLELGDRSYSAEQAMYILRVDSRDDTSMALAAQLIVAELNIMRGADEAGIVDVLDDAHDLIGELDDRRSLPLDLRACSPAGQDALDLAVELARWNMEPCL